MAIRVVCNKKLDLTADEWGIYQKIVKSYTTQLNNGENLYSKQMIMELLFFLNRLLRDKQV
jgi:hypothetical protein